MSLETISIVNSEPLAVYFDRTSPQPGPRSAIAPDAQAYVDADPELSLTAVLEHFAGDTPGLLTSSVRAASRVVEYLAGHPGLDEQRRQTLLGCYTSLVERFGIARPES